MRRSRSGDTIDIEVEGLAAPVEVRRSARAGRLTLRVNEARRGAVLTMPLRASLGDAGDFLNRHAAWLRERLAALPAPVPFADGALVPLRGITHAVRLVGRVRGRGVVWTVAGDDGTDRAMSWDPASPPSCASPPAICVAGDREHVARRLADWLRREARKDLSARVARHAETLELQPKRLTVRDQATRWGSCSTTGALSFSWRLILAPHFVLDYVAAHEVAHMKEMNHGPAFWRLVRRAAPRTDEARRWLKTHGATLHRYGADG